MFDFMRWQSQHGLTNPQMAKLLGVSTLTVVNWRMGKHSIPKSTVFMLVELTDDKARIYELIEEEMKTS